MKKQILILFILTCVNYIYSQGSKKGIIHYSYIDKHYDATYNSYLVFNQNYSYYVTAKDSLGISGEKIGRKNQENTLVEAVDFDDIKKTRKDGLQVFLDIKADSIYFTNAFSLTSKMLYSKEKKTKLIWDFKNEFKKIGKFNCKKAVTNFRGRDYICWYTQEIPLPYGPWKLQGLPGTILEAKSKDGFFEIIFKKIKYPTQDTYLPSNKDYLLKKELKFIPLNAYKLKQKEYIKIKDNSLKILSRKHNVQVDSFSEKLNFLEIFNQK